MEKLINGIVEFQKEDFEAHKELFTNLKDSQSPHTLFIGCSDSRVVPNLITKTLPGELFVVRNIANIVPPYRKTDEFVSTTSAIEFALQVLGISNVVICGHSNCGGCAALYKNDEFFKEIPHVKKWLELSKKSKKQVLKVAKKEGFLDDFAKIEWLTEQTNVVEQIQHLLTYPFIKSKFKRGVLKIYGWHYIIETGEVFNYNIDSGVFELIS